MNDMLADAGDRPEPLPRSSLPAERAEVTGILRRLASEHLTLAVTGLFSLWSVIVLLRVSDWDPLTAKAILEQSGTANVLLGTLVSFITGYLPSAIAITIGVLLHEHAAGRRKLNVWAFSGLLCCGGILLARANFLWGLSFGLLMVISLASGEWRWHGAQRAWNVLVTIIACVFGFIGYVPGAMGWMPSEVVTLKSEKKLVGYVLHDGGDERWAILKMKPRVVVYVDGKQIASRALCVEPVPWFLSRRFPRLEEPMRRYELCPTKRSS